MTSFDELSGFDALISSFRDSFGNAVVVELERDGESELASALRRALDGPDAAAADYAIERTYVALKTYNTWPTPAWCECYVLAQLRRCVELLRGGGTAAREAQRALDMTLIFGAPSEPLRGLMDAAERACFAGDEDARLTYMRSARTSGLLFPDEPPTTSDGGRGDMLERVEGTELTTKDFKQRFYSTDTPVVLANLGKDWRALHVWDDLEWWKRFHGHRCVPLELGRYADVLSWREDVKTVTDFVDEYLIPSLRDDSQNIAYLAQHQLIDQLADLRRDFDVPALCAKSLERINAWIGTAGTVTPCHFDTYDNLLGQVAGYKLVRLYLESDTPYMYRSTESSSTSSKRHSQGNFSAVDVENPDLERFPDFARAKAFDVILGPGDFVFIPARCWHYVRSLTASISLNFWF